MKYSITVEYESVGKAYLSVSGDFKATRFVVGLLIHTGLLKAIAIDKVEEPEDNADE